MDQEKAQTQPGKSGEYSTAGDGGTVDSREPEILDFDKLLANIPGDNPAGDDLRYEGTYDKIQEERRADDPSLPQGVWERGLKKADWTKVYRLANDAIANRSKDLQIAIWLMESLVKLHGFKGLREGLDLINKLCDEYWDTMFPELDEDDAERRVGPIYWLNQKLAIILKMVPITNPQATVDSVAYTFEDWEKAMRLEREAATDKNILAFAEAEGKITRAKFLGSVMFSTKTFYQSQSYELGKSIELLETFDQFLDNKCGRDAPSVANFKTILIDVQQVCNNFLKEKVAEEPVFTQEDETDAPAVYDESGQEIMNRKPFLSIRNRAEAYRMLSEAADYLLIHEPHSPTPYLVKRAVTWGQLTLTELLKELVQDELDLNHIFNLLGLKMTERT